MDTYWDALEAQFAELSTRISHLEPLNDQPSKFAALDAELVAHIAEIREHYAACRRIEELQDESRRLDSSINSILFELDECRKQLEKPSPAPALPMLTPTVNAQTLLDYATKITRFTRKMPGSVDPSILPWPAEDQLRRGMLATFTIQDEQAHQPTEPEPEPEPEHKPETERAAPAAGPSEGAPGADDKAKRPRRPRQKISLDFDSDDD